MSLNSLSPDVLEVVLNHVEIVDKSNLLMIGNKQLLAKLAQVDTDISILPYKPGDIDTVSQDEDGTFHVTVKYTSCTNKKLQYTLADSRQAVYGLLPLYYKNAKFASIHDIHLERTMKILTKLEKLHVYIRPNLFRYLCTAPSTLQTLKLDLHVYCDTSAVVDCLPKTLTSLTMRYTNGNHVDLWPSMIDMLPQGLISLSGVQFNYDERVKLLPQNLTYLECFDLSNVSELVLPSKLTHIETNNVNLAALAHLPLVNLRCYITSKDNLSLLHSLTKLQVVIQCNSDYENHLVKFPSTLTDLALLGSHPVRCAIPKSVTTLKLHGNYSTFEEATHTWRFRGVNTTSITSVPKNVQHAIIEVTYADVNDFNHILPELANSVQSLQIITDGYDRCVYDFSGFTKCTKLILSDVIQVDAFPPSITYADVKVEELRRQDFVWPTTLKHLVARNYLMSYETKKLRVSYLECFDYEIIQNIDCIAHIEKVVLLVPDWVEDSALCSLPPNARYEFYDDE